MPMTFLFDQNMGLSCVVSGVPQSGQSDSCADAVTASDTDARGTLFYRNTDSRQLINIFEAPPDLPGAP